MISKESSDDANHCMLQPMYIKNSMCSRDLSDHILQPLIEDNESASNQLKDKDYINEDTANHYMLQPPHIKNSMSSRDLSDHILQPLTEDNVSASNQLKDKDYINEDTNRSEQDYVIKTEQPIAIERKMNYVSLSADNSTIGSNSSSETMLKSEDVASRNRVLNVLGTLDDLLDIRDLMAANKEDSLVMTEACARLQFLASDDNCMPGAAQVGLVSEVVEAMDLHLKEERLQEKGCAALYYFAVSGAENKNAIMHADGILTVITAMSHFEKNGSIQEWACQCLASFSEGNSQNKMSTGVYGGIERIIKAMKANEEWTFVQSYGMKALWSLTVGSHENAIQVFEADGVNVIVKAFTQINSADVKTLAEYYGVGALFSMASTNEVQILKSIAKAGMTEVFIRLIREHRNFTDVVEKSVATLIQFMVLFTPEAFNFVEKGGIPVIIGAMKEFHNNYSIQNGGCTIFKILMKLSTMHGKKIVENDGIDAIYSAIESFGCLQDEYESTATLLLGFL